MFLSTHCTLLQPVVRSRCNVNPLGNPLQLVEGPSCKLLQPVVGTPAETVKLPIALCRKQLLPGKVTKNNGSAQI